MTRKEIIKILKEYGITSIKATCIANKILKLETDYLKKKSKSDDFYEYNDLSSMSELKSNW